MIHWLMILSALLVLLPAAAFSQPEEFLVTGVVSEVSAGRMVLVLDRDGYPGQKRGDAIVFTLLVGSRVVSREGLDAHNRLAPREQANVTYYKGKAGALVVREVQLLGPLPPSVPLPGREPAPASGGGSGPGNPAGEDGLVLHGGKTGARLLTVRLTEVRLQQTARTGDADIERVKAGTEFYIGFYVLVDTTIPLKLEYRCMRPDFDAKPANGEQLAPLRACDYQETVPAGFQGVRYHSFKMKYAPNGITEPSGDLIVAEVTPVIEASDGVTRPWQRKLKPVQVLP